MRLGSILFGTRFSCGIPYRYRGKYRTVKKPTMEQLNKLRDDFGREEQNMLLLRHPYLTVEQEHNHMKGLKPPTNEVLERFKELQREKFRKQVTIADHLTHLRFTEAWD